MPIQPRGTHARAPMHTSRQSLAMSPTCPRLKIGNPSGREECAHRKLSGPAQSLLRGTLAGPSRHNRPIHGTACADRRLSCRDLNVLGLLSSSPSRRLLRPLPQLHVVAPRVVTGAVAPAPVGWVEPATLAAQEASGISLARVGRTRNAQRPFPQTARRVRPAG